MHDIADRDGDRIAVLRRHHQPARSVDITRDPGDLSVAKIDPHLATESREAFPVIHPHAVELFEPPTEMIEEAGEHAAAIDRAAGLQIAGRRHAFELRRDLWPVDVAADTDDDRAHAPVALDVSFRKDPGELPVTDHEVVRPLHSALETGDVFDRVTQRQRGRHREHVDPVHGEFWSQQHRDEQRGSRRCAPCATSAPPALRLLIRNRDKPGGGSAASFVEDPTIGGVDGREALQPPADPVGGLVTHRP